MVDGLYVLQFRKCEDVTCCTKRNGDLPPKVPAPVMGPDGEHYLSFEMKPASSILPVVSWIRWNATNAANQGASSQWGARYPHEVKES